jgi:hypothetical protein
MKASSNGSLMSDSTPIAISPTVLMGRTRSSLLCHHSSDGTVAAGRSPVAIEGYRPMVQRHILVVDVVVI